MFIIAFFFISDNKPKKLSRLANDPVLAKKVWEVSCDLVGLPLLKSKTSL